MNIFRSMRKIMAFGLLAIVLLVGGGFFFFFMSLFLANYILIKSIKKNEWISYGDLRWEDFVFLILPFVIFVPLGLLYPRGLAIGLCIGIVILLGALLLYIAPKFYKKFRIGTPLPNYIYRIFIGFGVVLLAFTYFIFKPILNSHFLTSVYFIFRASDSGADFYQFWLIFAIPITIILIIYGIFGPKWFGQPNKNKLK